MNASVHHVEHPAVKEHIMAVPVSWLITHKGRPLHVSAPGHPFTAPVNGRNNCYFPQKQKAGLCSESGLKQVH